MFSFNTSSLAGTASGTSYGFYGHGGQQKEKVEDVVANYLSTLQSHERQVQRSLGITEQRCVSLLSREPGLLSEQMDLNTTLELYDMALSVSPRSLEVLSAIVDHYGRASLQFARNNRYKVSVASLVLRKFCEGDTKEILSKLQVLFRQKEEQAIRNQHVMGLDRLTAFCLEVIRYGIDDDEARFRTTVEWLDETVQSGDVRAVFMTFAEEVLTSNFLFSRPQQERWLFDHIRNVNAGAASSSSTSSTLSLKDLQKIWDNYGGFVWWLAKYADDAEVAGKMLLLTLLQSSETRTDLLCDLKEEDFDCLKDKDWKFDGEDLQLIEGFCARLAKAEVPEMDDLLMSRFYRDFATLSRRLAAKLDHNEQEKALAKRLVRALGSYRLRMLSACCQELTLDGVDLNSFYSDERPDWFVKEATRRDEGKQAKLIQAGRLARGLLSEFISLVNKELLEAEEFEQLCTVMAGFVKQFTWKGKDKEKMHACLENVASKLSAETKAALEL